MGANSNSELLASPSQVPRCLALPGHPRDRSQPEAPSVAKGSVRQEKKAPKNWAVASGLHLRPASSAISGSPGQSFLESIVTYSSQGPPSWPPISHL